MSPVPSPPAPPHNKTPFSSVCGGSLTGTGSVKSDFRGVFVIHSERFNSRIASLTSIAGGLSPPRAGFSSLEENSELTFSLVGDCLVVAYSVIIAKKSKPNIPLSIVLVTKYFLVEATHFVF